MRRNIRIIGIVIVTIVVLGSLLLAAKSHTDWNTWLSAHHCREVGNRHGKYWSRTIYRCDGGEIITR